LVEKHLLVFENEDEHLSPESVKVPKSAKRSKHSTVNCYLPLGPPTIDLTTETMLFVINFDQFTLMHVGSSWM